MREKKILTREQIAAYIATGGTKCPFCGSEDIEGGSVQVDAGSAWQHVDCKGCGEAWDDVYTLAWIEPGEYGEWTEESKKGAADANR
jgi:transcription elongation factor Elf1